MFRKEKPQVLVVGAGPVGLFAALALHRRGIPVQIVDREWKTGSHSFALALHAASLDLFEEVGLLADVLENAYRVRSVGLYRDGERQAEMRISDLAEDHSFLGVIQQRDLEQKLEGALKAAGVKVLWNHEVADLEPVADGVRARIHKLDQDTMGYGVQHSEWIVTRKKQLEVPFVIGTDGYRSVVRRALGVDFPTVAPSKDFAVFEFRTDADLGHEMRLLVAGDTLNLCWPLPGNCCRWSFQVPDYAPDWDVRERDRQVVEMGAQRFPRLTDQRLRELLAERAPWFRGSVEAITWRVMVRFESRMAESFGRERMWLAGDAAHLTGPAGVQSMNVGFREAWDLTGVLAGILHGEASPADLEKYDLARRTEWRRLLGVEGGLEAGPQTDPWIAGLRTDLLSCIPASGLDLTRLAEQMGLSCPA